MPYLTLREAGRAPFPHKGGAPFLMREVGGLIFINDNGRVFSYARKAGGEENHNGGGRRTPCAPTLLPPIYHIMDSYIQPDAMNGSLQSMRRKMQNIVFVRLKLSSRTMTGVISLQTISLKCRFLSPLYPFVDFLLYNFCVRTLFIRRT